jgi:hypothetical protein
MQHFPEHGTKILRHEDERESWSFALRKPIPPLRALVHGYYQPNDTGNGNDDEEKIECPNPRARSAT